MGHKKYLKYKAGDTYYLRLKKEKLTIASYNNPNELVHQISEILNACLQKKKKKKEKRKAWLLGK